MTPLNTLLLLSLFWLMLQTVWLFTYPEKHTFSERILVLWGKAVNRTSTHTGIYVGISSILIILSGFFSPWPAYDLQVPLSYLGVFICFSGLILCVWAKLTMKTNWGMPAQHDVKRQNQLVITGPYAYTRNPIYLGLWLMITGTGLAMQSYLVVLSVPFYYHFTGIIEHEEPLLTKYFKSQYTNYKNKIPRFL